MTTCDYCGKTVESEQAAITGIGWVVCPTCAKVYGKLDGIVTKAEKPQLASREKLVCSRCHCEVEEEKDSELEKEYPYYCPECDENLYSFETTEKPAR